MSFPKTLPAGKTDSITIIGVVRDGKSMALSTQSGKAEISADALSQLGAQSTPETGVRHLVGGRVFFLLGLGHGKHSEAGLREAAGFAARQCKDFAELIFDLPTRNAAEAIALLEGACLGSYSFEEFKSQPKPLKTKSVRVVTTHKPTEKSLAQVETLVSAVESIRNLGNTPPNLLYPAKLADAIKRASKGTDASVEVWDVKKLEEERCAGILSVGKGSSRPPRLIKVDYKPKGATKHLALVGKGITFDTGGLTLKPGTGMLGMKFDMAGAATVGLAAIAIAKLGLPIRVTAYLCVAENMPSATATRPTDVIKFRNGKTVEVTNTDAEGRLVLADGLILASESKPDLIVDVATLTGGARVALGVRTAGLMGTDGAVVKLKAAAETTGEALWHMPLPQELRKLLKSDTADLVNSKLGNPSGSMLVGGHFLKEFVGNQSKDSEELIEWAHLDIAGPANNEDAPFGYTPAGGTGVMLRTLVEVAKAL